MGHHDHEAISFNEAEARVPRMLVSSHISRRAHLRRFNEAEARVPRMLRDDAMSLLHIDHGFNEAEARVPRMRGFENEHLDFNPALQ